MPSPTQFNPIVRRSRTLRGWLLRGIAAAAVVGVAVWLLSGVVDWPASKRTAVESRPPTPNHRATESREPASAEAVSLAPRAAEVADALSKIEPSVALIEADGPRGLAPIGSAFVVDASGLVATSYHVAAETTQAVARFRDGTVYEIEGYAAVDREHDLAILKLRSPSQLIAATLQAETPAPLTAVIALGHPRGVEFSPYDGKVSRLVTTAELPSSTERFIRELTGSQREQRWIQHTASLSDGNSGGPLVNSAGRVIGINTWVDRTSGFSYALPAAEIEALLNRARGEIEPLERRATSEARLRAIAWQTSAQQLQQLHDDAQAMRWQPANRGDYTKLQHLAWGITLANQPQLVGGAGALGDRHEELVKTADRIVARLRKEPWNEVGQITLLNEFAAPEIARPAAGLVFFGTIERIVQGKAAERVAIVRLAGFEQRMIVPLESGLSAPKADAQCLFVGVNDRGRTMQYGDNPLQPIVAPVIVAPVIIELGQ